ncbi:ribonuclease P protein subunit RPR2 [Pelomyxa schiedti]|nr:ribonuclease P protein subunit RPR2 [Pelomyxa schiedti]
MMEENNGTAAEPSKKALKVYCNEDSFKRMNYLHQASLLLLPAVPQLSAIYSRTLRTVAQKQVLRLSPSLKRSLCRICSTPLVAGVTARAKVCPWRRTHVAWRCRTCGALRRYHTVSPRALAAMLLAPGGGGPAVAPGGCGDCTRGSRRRRRRGKSKQGKCKISVSNKSKGKNKNKNKNQNLLQQSGVQGSSGGNSTVTTNDVNVTGTNMEVDVAPIKQGTVTRHWFYENLFSPTRDFSESFFKLMMASFAVVLAVVFVILTATVAGDLVITSDRVTLSNNFFHSEFDLANPCIDVIKGSVLGTGDFSQSPNVLSTPKRDSLNRKGIVLEMNYKTLLGYDTTASSLGASSSLSVEVLRNDTSGSTVVVHNVVDDPGNPTLTSDWTLSLESTSRYMDLSVVVQPVTSTSILSSQLAFYLVPKSIYTLFDDRGVIQMMDSPGRSISTNGPVLNRMYALGGGSVEIWPSGAAISKTTTFSSTVADQLMRTGFHIISIGEYPDCDNWDLSQKWQDAPELSIDTTMSWTVAVQIYASEYDFPSSMAPEEDLECCFDDVRARLTSIYGTAVGALVSYYNETAGEMSPTLATPSHSYSDLYNFYDPDTWFCVTSLLYSGDPFLHNEARKLVELSGDYILETGQIPHHFIVNEPTYIAISGATQTGPNCFWTLAALEYVKITGDYEWLSENIETIRKAVSFLTNLISPNDLVLAPGPLWIDVFIRNNYTSDTNSLLVYLFREMAELEIFLNNPSAADQLRDYASNMASAINSLLLSPDGDHYITQLNPDGTTRDFVDYDSNLLAVAFNIPSSDLATKILKRVDAGPCTHARATYVSEVYYDAANCYNGNTGDSAVTMGRIGWADAHARYAVQDATTFESLLLQPLVNDLFDSTWLYERYTCEAKPTHNPYYHEYPETLVQLIHEVAYGIDLGINNITVNPLSRTSYYYTMGTGSLPVTISYSTDLVVLSNLPGDGKKYFTIGHLHPMVYYKLVQSPSGITQRIEADVEGVVKFVAYVGPGTTNTLSC